MTLEMVHVERREHPAGLLVGRPQGKSSLLNALVGPNAVAVLVLVLESNPTALDQVIGAMTSEMFHVKRRSTRQRGSGSRWPRS
jgi:predicted GTPase